MNKYAHLFFDLDHTLWDFESNSKRVIHSLYQDFQLELLGIESRELFFQVFTIENEKLWWNYRNGNIVQETLRWQRFRNTLSQFHIVNESLARDLSHFYIQNLPAQQTLLPHAMELLEYCRDKEYHLHIITNGMDEVQHRKMQISNIDGFFKEVITSEKSNSLKPHRQIFDYALTAAGANVSNALMIGDNWEADIIGAQLAGIEQVFYNPLQVQVDGKPTYEIACLSDLKSIL